MYSRAEVIEIVRAGVNRRTLMLLAVFHGGALLLEGFAFLFIQNDGYGPHDDLQRFWPVWFLRVAAGAVCVHLLLLPRYPASALLLSVGTALTQPLHSTGHGLLSDLTALCCTVMLLGAGYMHRHATPAGWVEVQPSAPGRQQKLCDW